MRNEFQIFSDPKFCNFNTEIYKMQDRIFDFWHKDFPETANPADFCYFEYFSPNFKPNEVQYISVFFCTPTLPFDFTYLNFER